MTPMRISSLDGIDLEAAVHPARSPISGTAVLAHGITSDMDEGGMFVALGERLAAEGWNAVRFSFRGHGRSGGTDRGATVAGEMLDLEAVIEKATRMFGDVDSVVAASFGAVSVCLSLPYLEADLKRLVLWNPVLDLVDTFVEPTLPWGREQFGDVARTKLRQHGTSLTDATFHLGRVMFSEMAVLDPLAVLGASAVPLLIVHGDRDMSVSYDVSRRTAEGRPGSKLLTITGADHGFGGAANVTAAIEATVDWIRQGAR